MDERLGKICAGKDDERNLLCFRVFSFSKTSKINLEHCEDEAFVVC